jgi:glycosyltransferase involved in cell wall biosynthesis
MAVTWQTENLHLIVTSGVNGGGIRGCFAALARAFRDTGASVTMFASPGEQYPGLKLALEESGIGIVQDRSFGLASSASRRHAARQLVDFVIQHTGGSETEWMLLGASVREALTFGPVRRTLARRGKRVRVSIQFYSMHHQSRVWPLFYVLGGAVYRRDADWVFAPCAAERRRLILSGFPASRCSVAHLPISTAISSDSVSPSPSLIRLQEQIGVAPFIAFLGNFYPVKGQADILRMMPHLLPEFPQLKAVLAGEGPSVEACRRKASSLGVAGSVLFPGRLPQSDIPVLMKSCSVAVVPSRSETFGYCIAEPLLLGVPVVTTRVGVAPELASLGAVRTFLTGRVESAASEIAYYLRNPDLARREAAQGQEYVSRTCLATGVVRTMLETWRAS